MLKTVKILVLCAFAVGLLAGFYFIPSDNVISKTGDSPLFAASLNSTAENLKGDPNRGTDSKGGPEGNLQTCEITCGPTCNQTTCGATCVATCEFTCTNTCAQSTCNSTCVSTCAQTCANTCSQPTCESTCVVTCSYTCEVPITLLSFGAEADVNHVNLHWNTASEVNNYRFIIWRSTSEGSNFTALAEIPSQGNSINTVEYSFVDQNVSAGVTYYYMLSDVNIYSYETMHATVASATPLADTFVLEPNYPNPFNPETTIRFNLPVTSAARLDVYDMSGRLVNTLVNGTVEAGLHQVSWNATDVSGSILPSGVYIYRLTAGDYSASAKMIFVK
ncbi:MAG: T9SS type A sorting domain-containing protein [bacterium]